MDRSEMFATERYRELISNTRGSVGQPNNDTVQSSLEFIGLSPSEVTIYRTLLALGPRPASIVAKRVGMQRTRVYDVMMSLESRGLVEITHREKVRHFAPTSQEKLLALIEERREAFSERAQQCKSIVPMLFERSTENGSGLEINRAKGARQVKELLLSMLEEDVAEIIVIGDLERSLQLHPALSHWTPEYRMKRIQRGITLKAVVQGPPDLFEERGLLRETLSSPEIPADQLLILGKENLLLLTLNMTPELTIIENRSMNSILKGLYRSWHLAATRLC